MDKTILHYYTNYNFPNAKKLYDILKSHNVKNITHAQINKFSKKQKENQLIKIIPEYKRDYGHITAMKPNEEWQIDITVMRYSKKNDGYKYLFFVCDIFTRKLFSISMKTKDIKDTSRALEILIKKYEAPIIISSDNDSSFTGVEFQKILKKYNIIHNTNIKGDHFALGVIDRATRTIKTILNKYYLRNNTTRWIDIIDDLIDQYNDTPHRAILNLTPNEVDKSLFNLKLITYLNARKSLKNSSISDLSIGKKVRIKIKGQFDKGTDPVFSDTIYIVKNVMGKTITLEGGRVVKRSNLLMLPDDYEDIQPDDSNVVKRARKKQRVESKLKQVGMNEDNIITSKRQHKPNKKYT